MDAAAIVGPNGLQANDALGIICSTEVNSFQRSRSGQLLLSFSQTIQIQNAATALICINRYADYASGGGGSGGGAGSVYQPRSKGSHI